MVDIKSVLRLVRDGIETYAPDYMHGLPKRDYLKQIDAALAQPEQEPVVWMYQDKSTHEVRFQKHMRDFVDHGATYETPLYTTPPQRTWVGLTYEDKKEYVAQDFGGNRLDAMDWAEKRLKEKNT